MIRFVPFPKIGQYRNAIKDVLHYINKEGIKDTVFTFTGTVKLHGTNAAVSLDNDSNMWVQSRKRIISVGDDNYGFAQFVENNNDTFMDMLASVKAEYPTKTVTIFGEWCGGNIQTGVAISGLDKMFVIFAVAVSSDEGSIEFLPQAEWQDLHDTRVSVYNINNFNTYSINIDFSKPSNSQNALAGITESVEQCCPVGAALGSKGIGEGVVWTGRIGEELFMFKVKGKKHSVSKVKTLASVNPEHIKAIDDFSDYAATNQRVIQAMNEIHAEQPPEAKHTGDIIRWVIGDIKSEEADVIAAAVSSGVTEKDLFKTVGKTIARMYKNKVEDI